MNATIAWLTFRSLFGRRWIMLLLLLLPALLVGGAVLMAAATDVPPDAANAVMEGLGFAVVMPVVSLLIATSALGAEIDDGTVVHILAKPVPRLQIVTTKYVVAAGLSILTVGLPMFLAGTLLESPAFGAAVAVGSTVGVLAYTGLFLTLSLVSRRAVPIGLVYILVWEGLLGRTLTGTKNLSIEQYALTVADKLEPTRILSGEVTIATSLVFVALFVVGGVLLSTDRLRSLTMAGETS
jgi:ABC-2 type transport system permease protein